MTVQRRAVAEALLALPDHPSADEILAEVTRRLPGVSRTTIYRTVEQLVERGIIGRVCHPAPVVRYDARTDDHHHLICLECNAILDFTDPSLDRLPIPDTSRSGFQVRDIRVQLRGLCGRCRRTTQRRKEDSR
jgi:Fur family peroxide stress response transcriptional regulator